MSHKAQRKQTHKSQEIRQRKWGTPSGEHLAGGDKGPQSKCHLPVVGENPFPQQAPKDVLKVCEDTKHTSQAQSISAKIDNKTRIMKELSHSQELVDV
eukprot:1711009-Amphidinium_carterae.1